MELNTAGLLLGQLRAPPANFALADKASVLSLPRKSKDEIPPVLSLGSVLLLSHMLHGIASNCLGDALRVSFQSEELSHSHERLERTRVHILILNRNQVSLTRNI